MPSSSILCAMMQPNRRTRRCSVYAYIIVINIILSIRLYILLYTIRNNNNNNNIITGTHEESRHDGADSETVLVEGGRGERDRQHTHV